MSYKYTVIRFVALFLAFATFIGFFPLNALAKQEEKEVERLIYVIEETMKTNSSNKDEVFELQIMLNRILECNIIVDGLYGTITQGKVEEFQEKYKLEVTGKVDEVTRKKLNSVYAYLANIKKAMVRVNSYLNVRKGPSTDFDEIGRVYNGEVYRIYLTKENWYYIKTKSGQYGWICADYTTGNFVEISIGKQFLTFYLNNIEILFSPVVTGCVANQDDTPKGIFTLTHKSKDTMLMENSLVNYWMKFYMGIGCHDAPWRTKFGGDIYLTGGSHGCVNMPFIQAELLYKYIEVKTTIVVRE